MTQAVAVWEQVCVVMTEVLEGVLTTLSEARRAACLDVGLVSIYW